MLGLLKIYFLFNLHFILIKCIIPNNLSVRILDKKVIEKKRQDTREMCRIFNSETLKANLPTRKKGNSNKYDKRKQETKENKELEKKRFSRPKRDVGTSYAVNPALNVEDEERVEKIVDGIYDDLLEKGQKIAYRRREVPKPETKDNKMAANNSRRFPFAPVSIEGPTTTRAPMNMSIITDSKPARFYHAIIPYFIDSRTYDSHLSSMIIEAFNYFEKATCIRLQRLRERPTDLQSLQNVIWLYITNPAGIRQCVHSNERAEIKGVQMIVFGYDCMSLGDITHEIMHVLGFGHEHARPDRDQHITILWDNIKPGYRKYFELHNESIVENLPYDYASVLHYPARAFSRNGQVTILTKPGIKIGQREGLSEMDVEKIGALYSNECVKRNREYLLKTCPSVVNTDISPEPIKQKDIDDYFEDRIWPYGVVYYRLKDRMEFSTEEIENMKVVMRHIEKETCIEFKDITPDTTANQKESESSETKTKIDNDGIDKFVQLGVDPNSTKATLPDWDTSDETNQSVTKPNEIEDTNTGRKGVVGKDSIVIRKKQEGKKQEGKEPAPGARIKRALHPGPTRRHANKVLILSRSPKPGCICPKPGKPQGTYVIDINTDCFNTVNDLLHLFVHVLGLDHQHNMYDRDAYLHIAWNQLTDDVKKDMQEILPPAASVGFPYDYQSVMHYPWLQIKNGRTNIMYPIWNDGWAMGHWQGLSSTDVQKLNLLYFKQCMLRKEHAEEAKPTDIGSDTGSSTQE